MYRQIITCKSMLCQICFMHYTVYIYIYTPTFLYIFYTLHMMTTQLRLPWCCSEARRLGITLNAIPFAHSKDSTWRLSNSALCSGWKFIVTWLPALLHPCHFPALSNQQVMVPPLHLSLPQKKYGNTHNEQGISNYQNTKTQLHIDANHMRINE